MSAVKSALLGVAVALGLSAHVGSPDVFFQGKAGPYPLLVSIRPPDVIPGVARIEVRAKSADIRDIQLTPTPMTGPAATHPPIADVAQRSKADPQLFEGNLWLMTPGSWEVHIRANGGSGSGELAVPVAAVAQRIKPMQRGVGYFLFGMMIFLTAGGVAIVGAGARESLRAPGTPDSSPWSRKALLAMGVASVALIVGLWFGGVWWGQDDASNRKKLYRPLQITAALQPGPQLQLRLTDPGWLPLRKVDDLVPDHGHLMHLFLVRWPRMDRVYHLHPEQTATGFFEGPAPSLPAGDYKIYADVVHENGLAETAVGDVTLPDVAGHAISGDDAAGPSLPRDGYRMVRVVEDQPIIATQLELFSFEIVGPDGKPVNDLEPYMGMGGHAEFLKEDGTVFAHVHPSGSVSMASIAVASPEAMMAMHETHPGPVVSFPYGLPTPGKYKIFVQLKRAGKVETGEFDVTAKPKR